MRILWPSSHLSHLRNRPHDPGDSRRVQRDRQSPLGDLPTVQPTKGDPHRRRVQGAIFPTRSIYSPDPAAARPYRSPTCDINPVAWLYAAVKTKPHPSPPEAERRIEAIATAVRRRDRQPADEFQSLGFGPRALGFINAARRELQWRHSVLDRTVAGFLLHYLHAKLGQGLSNQMRPSRAMCPSYSVRWWRKRRL